jgi:hypothetical protein
MTTTISSTDIVVPAEPLFTAKLTMRQFVRALIVVSAAGVPVGASPERPFGPTHTYRIRNQHCINCDEP